MREMIFIRIFICDFDLPHNMIVKPRCSLLSPVGIILAHHDFSQSKTVRFENDHDPT